MATKSPLTPTFKFWRTWLIGFAGWIAFVIFMGLLVEQSHAQACFNRDQFMAGLKERYGEVVLWEGLMTVQGGAPVPVVMFASPSQRTWTITTNSDPAFLCPVMNGTSFDLPSSLYKKSDKEVPEL